LLISGVYWKKLEPITNKILILTDCPPPRAAGKNPQSRFAGQQAGKNYFPLKPLSFLPACFGASWGNFYIKLTSKNLIYPIL